MSNVEQLKSEIKARMNGKIQPCYSLNIDTNHMGMKDVVQQAINEALTNFKDQLVDAVVDELYSDEKFELDIGLRDGDIRDR